MTAETGGLTYVAGTAAPTGVNTVSVLPVSVTAIVLSGQAKTGTCFYVLDNEAAGSTVYAKLPGTGARPACFAVSMNGVGITRSTWNTTRPS